MKSPINERILRIALVRHGETSWNRARRFQGRSNVALNEKGRAQARAIALNLREEPLIAIYSSPISRAIETAEAVNCYHQVPLQQRDGLMEMNFGDFDGMLADDFSRDQPDFLRKWFEDPAAVRMPNGESLQEVQVRSWAVMEEIVKKHYEGSVLVCGHNFVNTVLLCNILGLELTNFRRLRQSLGAVSIIERTRGLYSMVCVNDTCHLKGLDQLA